ncbi:GGDEF domain-containing protein [Sphingomonas sp. GCM10030256]|uniref:GGDEF domain-containing protein n=1 Tax=Sphingomonas sp. GCM10030256 TaxID=3273427 RepID=UPI00361622AC
MTGLPNRRAFHAFAQGRAANGADCIALLDIDHFKIINDTFGHGTGDEVLRGFAQAARQVVRQGDMLARVGGEEFAIFFPDTSIDQALAICERLRRVVAAAPLANAGQAIHVTVSGGVARLGPEGLDDAMRTADTALYRAKQAGRNRLALAA